jgi:phage/plasmid primase-like uncharacterized protein
VRSISVIFLLALFALASNVLIINCQFAKKYNSEIKSTAESEQSEEENSEESKLTDFEEDFTLNSMDKSKQESESLYKSGKSFHYFRIHIPTAFHNLGVYSPPEHSLV